MEKNSVKLREIVSLLELSINEHVFKANIHMILRKGKTMLYGMKCTTVELNESLCPK